MQKRFFSKTALQSSDFKKSDEILRLKDVFLIQLSVLFFGVFLPFDEIPITRSIKCEKGCETLWFTSTTQWNETFTFATRRHFHELIICHSGCQCCRHIVTEQLLEVLLFAFYFWWIVCFSTSPPLNKTKTKTGNMPSWSSERWS